MTKLTEIFRDNLYKKAESYGVTIVYKSDNYKEECYYILLNEKGNFIRDCFDLTDINTFLDGCEFMSKKLSKRKKNEH